MASKLDVEYDVYKGYNQCVSGNMPCLVKQIKNTKLGKTDEAKMAQIHTNFFSDISFFFWFPRALAHSVHEVLTFLIPAVTFSLHAADFGEIL